MTISKEEFDNTLSKIADGISFNGSSTRNRIFDDFILFSDQQSGGVLDTFYLAIVDQFG